jgi:hypothetical protein
MGGIGVLLHSEYVSSLPVDKINDENYDPWYVLQSDNEIINFIDEDGKQKNANSLFIEAESTNLKIKIDDYILYIPANESRSYDFETIQSIQVMNTAGTKLRWSILCY